MLDRRRRCSTPPEFPGLAEGKHAFAVRGIDVADPAGKAVKAKWTVDLTPPQATIAKHPTNPTTSTTAAFKLASTGNQVDLRMLLDSAAFTACNKTISYKNLATGPHTFSTKATDRAGNTSSPTTWGWTITP